MIQVLTCVFVAFAGLSSVYSEVSWAQSPGQPAPADPSSFIFLLIAMFAIMYFVVIRPQQKEQKKHQERINALKKGDRVVTSGGIHGLVKAVKDATLVVEIAPNVKIRLTRQSVSSVLEPEEKKGKKSQDKEDTSDEDEDDYEDEQE